jgi:hypothetical protein
VKLISKQIHWLTLALIGIVIIWTQFNNHYWSGNRVLCWDVYGYSQYLSSSFIYNDIKNPEELLVIDSVYHTSVGVKGYGRHCLDENCNTIVFKYTMGNAVMMAPFYLTAHYVTVANKSFPADGYSEPYQLAVALSTCFWAVAGLAILILLLGKWFSPVVISITTMLIALGTNYFYYASLESGMTHIPSFFCIAVSLLSMLLWWEKKSWLYAFVFGLSTGMIALIRLPDLVFGIIPAILFIKTVIDADRGGRIKLVTQAAFVASLIAIVFLPQMIYWKHVSGSWLYYSYADEKFFFNNPHIIDGLFSYKKGWLLYTPVMLFAIAGILLVLKRLPWLGLGILLFLVVNVYVVFSWWMWWYGGSFGARSMIQSYAVLAIPLAFVVQWLCSAVSEKFKSKKVMAISLSCILLFFFVLNLFQTFQYKRGIIHYDSMTQKSYWGVFGKAKLNGEEWRKLYSE